MQDFNISRVSPIDKVRRTMVIKMNFEDYRAWRDDGLLIQQALPYLTADEREFIMTGITPEQWESIF